MKQVSRFVALLLCTSMVFSVVILQSESKNTSVTYNVLSTMSGDPNLAKQATTGTTPSEPYYSKQWSLYNDGTFTPVTEELKNINKKNTLSKMIPSPVKYGFEFLLYNKITAVENIDIDATKAWEVVGDSGRDVIVAIIDTGVDYTHEDLKEAIWINEGEISGDGIDNDANGYVDDVYGWDFYNDQPYVINSSSTDYNHATHVAGIIAATINNTGIAGIIPNNNVKIMTIKALGGSVGSGETINIVNAIEYAQKMGASICNISFGTERNDSALRTAIETSDMLFVCAAGNANRTKEGNNTDRIPIYPASYDRNNIISVANLTYDGTLDSTSNYGVASVDIAAPGSYILSTISNNSYGFMTGSSMAAPMVTAVVALIYSYHEDISLSEVKYIVLSSAEPLDSLKWKVTTGGMVNAYNAITFDSGSIEN